MSTIIRETTNLKWPFRLSTFSKVAVSLILLTASSGKLASDDYSINGFQDAIPWIEVVFAFVNIYAWNKYSYWKIAPAFLFSTFLLFHLLWDAELNCGCTGVYSIPNSQMIILCGITLASIYGSKMDTNKLVSRKMFVWESIFCFTVFSVSFFVADRFNKIEASECEVSKLEFERQTSQLFQASSDYCEPTSFLYGNVSCQECRSNIFRVIFANKMCGTHTVFITTEQNEMALAKRYLPKFVELKQLQVNSNLRSCEHFLRQNYY